MKTIIKNLLKTLTSVKTLISMAMVYLGVYIVSGSIVIMVGAHLCTVAIEAGLDGRAVTFLWTAAMLAIQELALHFLCRGEKYDFMRYAFLGLVFTVSIISILFNRFGTMVCSEADVALISGIFDAYAMYGVALKVKDNMAKAFACKSKTAK